MAIQSATAPPFIKAIHLRNLRGFKKLDLSFTDDNDKLRQRNLIIGRNATGKSTLLRAIVLGLCNPHEANALLVEGLGNYITQGEEEASIKLDFAEGMVCMNLRNSGASEFAEQGSEHTPPRIFLCAYGVTRGRAGTSTSAKMGILASTDSLFNADAELASPELTLRRLDDYLGTEIHQRAIKGIKRTLGLKPADRIELKRGGGITVSGASIGDKIPLAAWADGFRLNFMWIMDLYAHAIRESALTESGDIRGILLVDEVGQNLHPSLQSELLPRLSKQFPRMQIIATTHSPIVALGAAESELIVLQRGRKYTSVMKSPSHTGYSAEDLLTDERFFGTEAYAPEISQKLKTYRRIGKIPRSRRTAKDKQTLQRLGKEITADDLQVDSRGEDKFVKALNDIRKKYNI